MQPWVGPTAAISLVVIALSFIAIAVSVVAALRAMAHQVSRLSGEVEQLRGELAPTIQAVNDLARTSVGLTAAAKAEVESLLAMSQRVRTGIGRGVERVEQRLADLDALYEVVHSEVEDAALDVAATLRTVRRGTGVVGRLRRLILGRGRR
jgi:uncharacterized protein YoxC